MMLKWFKERNAKKAREKRDAYIREQCWKIYQSSQFFEEFKVQIGMDKAYTVQYVKLNEDLGLQLSFDGELFYSYFTYYLSTKEGNVFIQNLSDSQLDKLTPIIGEKVIELDKRYKELMDKNDKVSREWGRKKRELVDKALGA